MSVNAISDSSIIQSIVGTATAGATSAVPKDSASLSSRAQALQALQQLQASDPTKFKQVMAEIATKLQDAATQATGGQAQFLGKMAAEFQQASQTGQMPQAPAGAGGHHHHHHGAQGASAAQAYSSQSPATDVGAIISQALQDNGISAS
jgi:hypothetical protein